MAVRFSADGQDYTRAAALGPLTQFSITCWWKLFADRDSYQTAWCIDDGTTSDFSYLQTTNDGVTAAFYQNGSTAIAARALTVGTWYFWGVSVNGVNSTVVSLADTDAAFTATTSSGGNASTNGVNLRLGESIYNSEWLDGCLASVKIWSGVTLSQAEMEAEAFRQLPVRTAGLTAWYPFISDAVDYSGNAATLSGGSGTTWEAGPPITGSGRRTIILPSIATAKSLADSATATATDEVTVTAAVDLSDAATASESLTVAASADLADSATATDSLTVTVSLDLADSATAADTISGGIAIDFADSASADDTWTVVPTPVLEETAAAAEAVTVAATIPLADSAAASDAINVVEIFMRDLADSATASEALLVVVEEDITVRAGTPLRGWSARPPDGRSWSASDAQSDWRTRPPTT